MLQAALIACRKPLLLVVECSVGVSAVHLVGVSVEYPVCVGKYPVHVV